MTTTNMPMLTDNMPMLTETVRRIGDAIHFLEDVHAQLSTINIALGVLVRDDIIEKFDVQEMVRRLAGKACKQANELDTLPLLEALAEQHGADDSESP